MALHVKQKICYMERAFNTLKNNTVINLELCLFASGKFFIYWYLMIAEVVKWADLTTNCKQFPWLKKEVIYL